MTTYNLASLLETSAKSYPEREAIVFPATGRRMTYAEVDMVANMVANFLVSKGIQPGDKIALSCPNLPYFSLIYWGILKAGATVVPLNVLLKGREVAYHLADSDAKVLFCFEGTPELPIGQEGFNGFEETPGCETFVAITADLGAESPFQGTQSFGQILGGMDGTFETVETDEDDTAVILYTSGTTGQPKGAELRHRNMRDNALLGEQLFGASAEDPDTFLCVLPLFHSFGQTVIQNGSAAYAGTVVMLPRFEPGPALELMKSEGITYFAGVPTMYWALLHEASDPADTAKIKESLRVAVAGGAALPMEVHKEFEQKFGISILEGYGLSETSPVASFTPVGVEVRVGSIGKPVPGVEMKLIDAEAADDGRFEEIAWAEDAIGEIAIKGHNIMKGYYGRSEATDESIKDGWFRTGDLGRRDADGFYYIVDRSKDMIIRGGFNVYPREIEEVLLTHPDVSLAAVIGVAHESHGEEVKAVVILNEGASVTEDELIEWGKNEMAAYKYPRMVEFVSSLPMTATGKILKRELS